MPYDIKKDFIKEVQTLLSGGDATEHSYRPALRSLLIGLGSGVTVTNEPKRIDCGAPDLVIRKSGLVVGYVEAKDPAIRLSSIEDTDQLNRYRKNLDNLLLTNTHEFRWYVAGELRAQAALGTFDKKTGNLKLGKPDLVLQLLDRFVSRNPAKIKSAETLARRLAGLADAIRCVIIQAYEDDEASELLEGWRAAIAKVLIADLAEPSQTPRFADMIAQTLAYGLFTARIMDPTLQTFSRLEAQTLIPKSNPFLRQFFFQLSSPDVDEEPYGAYIDDIVTVLACTDIGSILRDFGKTTREQDPVVHFYETFLAAYDPRLRELRGVYYTPQPVVGYLVRSIDKLLVSKFGCPDGIADSSMITFKAKSPKQVSQKSHKVVILDPACGTGAFLYEVVGQIRKRFMQSNNAGLWPDYVRDHLLPRLFGFEILMAPYAIAHFKLSLELLALDLPETQRETWGFAGATEERLGVYLTNTLEPPHEFSGLPLFTQWLSAETNAANAIKADTPIMVVLGNPPYNNFGKQNVNDSISELLVDYKKGLVERKLNLDDDYIKFIRFAQDKIARTGYGIVAFITNSSFTTGLVHRRMRESLKETFSDIYVLNLHGNSVTGELPPGGGDDENVFDIKQGVAATIFVKSPAGKTPGNVWYGDLWGTRADKYAKLDKLDVHSVKWQKLKNIDDESCLGKFYFFKPTSGVGIDTYCEGFCLSEAFVTKHSGIQTKRDALFVDRHEAALAKRMKEVLKAGPTPEMSEKYPLTESSGWSPDKLEGVSYDPASLEPYAYRPYDWRHLYYDEDALGRPRRSVSPHLRKQNLALVFMRQTVDDAFRHVLASDRLTDLNYLMSHHVSDRVAPLYVYHSIGKKEEKRSNLSPAIKKEMNGRYGLVPIEVGRGDFKKTWGPEDLFYYVYAICWSPTFRGKFDEFLKIGFPRVPWVTDAKRFSALSALGEELAGLHLLRGTIQNLPSFPVPGANNVDRPVYQTAEQRLYINATQFFAGVDPNVWTHKIGCYSVVPRWLKERKGTVLSPEESNHFRRTLGALSAVPDVLRRIDLTLKPEPFLK